jgi:UDP-N-acetylglucosamine--N-acetylmuramyl-(pentapeptide) pyrophosphoryl-undecaprenol N-acetylglucosamine transferase
MPRRKTTPAQSTPTGLIFLTSGASGGHLFPALAVAAELQKMGLKCHFVVGGSKFNNLVENAGYVTHRLPASAFTDRALVGKLLGIFRLLLGVIAAYRLLKTYRPLAVFGTGGYASVATMLAAKVAGVPTFIHEQNVLPGRANRFIAKFAGHVLTTFESTQTYFPRPVVCVGTPLRAEVLAVAGAPRKASSTFNILVLGGSQGSGVLSNVVTEAVAAIKPAVRKHLTVVHQARPDDVVRVRAAYKKLNVHATVNSFFDDLPVRYVAAHVVVGRSGTGTLLEAATVGRAAIYSPHQLADNHQLFNARVAEAAGAALVLTAPEFTPGTLAAYLTDLYTHPAKLEKMATAARTLARPKAAQEVARYVIKQLET